MKKTKLKSIIFIILALIVIIFLCDYSTIYASSDGSGIAGAIGGADQFIEDGKTHTKIDQGNIKNLSDLVYAVLLALGTVIAVIIGAILGIRFMTGSVSEKSQVKEALIPYVIGCVVIFGAFGIWRLVVTLLQQV